jgi:hypothetical protein
MLLESVLAIEPVNLAALVHYPGLNEHVRGQTLAQARADLETRLTERAAAQRSAKEAAAQNSDKAVALADAAVAWAQANVTAVRAKIVADDARYANPPRPDADRLAREAGRADRILAIAAAELALLDSQRDLEAARAGLNAADQGSAMALADAAKKHAAVHARLTRARAEIDNDQPSYTPLGPIFPATSTGRRLALARWIVSRDNPLAARVAVNQIWARHFGAPLVETVFDFGLNGKPPSHPALLDWLAVEFMDRGWSLKTLHGLIVTSQAYRLQSSEAVINDPNRAIDPGNRYLWRMNPRRMEAELVRDNLLHAAGNLDTRQGGPDLDPNTAQTSPRRSLYFRHAKEKRALMLKLFDSANSTSCYRRAVSVVPQQALALANSPMSLDQSRLLAAQIAGLAGLEAGSDPAFVALSFDRILGRPPTGEEQSACLAFLTEQRTLLDGKTPLTPFATGPAASTKPAPVPAARARENLVHVLFNHHDFITIH